MYPNNIRICWNCKWIRRWGCSVDRLHICRLVIPFLPDSPRHLPGLKGKMQIELNFETSFLFFLTSKTYLWFRMSYVCDFKYKFWTDVGKVTEGITQLKWPCIKAQKLIGAKWYVLSIWEKPKNGAKRDMHLACIKAKKGASWEKPKKGHREKSQKTKGASWEKPKN